MKMPFLTEAVADMILRCLNVGGYLPNSGDLETIRNVSPTLDEAQRDALAISFTYGSGGGGGGSSDRLTSPTDCWVLLDNDNTDTTTPYSNYFSVIKGQTATPTTDPKRMIFSLGAQSGPDRNYVDAAFGPRLDQIGLSDDMGSIVTLGCGGDGVTKRTYGTLNTSKFGLFIQSHLSNTIGMMVQGGLNLGIGADNKVTFGRHSLGNTRGGFFNLTTHSRFGVGSDFFLSPTDNCLMLEKYNSDGSLLLYTPDVGTERSFYVFGNYNGATDLSAKWVHLAVGGQPGVTGQDPTIVPIEGNYVVLPADNRLNQHSATLLAVSPNRGNTVFSAVLQTWHRSSDLPDYATLVNHHSNLNLDAASDKIRLFSISGLNAGGLRTVIMATRADRTTWAYHLRSLSSSTGGLDIAEYFNTDHPTNSYPPGTVMISTGADKIVPSSSYASTAVVGAVTTKPGMVLGAQCDLNSKEDPTKDLFVPIALTGTTPVRVSLSHGEIELGNLLVSAENGLAAKAPENPIPGTVIGKALEPWLGPGEGKIKMLVLNR